MTRQSTEATIRGVSKKEGDRIADAVLALVRSIVELQRPPTGCGHMSPEDRHIVFDRSE